MAGNDFLTTMTFGNKCRTLSEAVEFMKLRDRLPTGTYPEIKWVSCKTGKPVSIGYT